MTITELLTDLEAKAKQATPDTWESNGNGVVCGRGTVATCPTPQHGGTFDAAQNADYIAACSPDRILALVEYVRKLEEAAHGLLDHAALRDDGVVMVRLEWYKPLVAATQVGHLDAEKTR